MSSSWRPTAELSALQLRAEALANIRAFFAERTVMEVDTPVLCHHSVTDPHIHAFNIELGPEEERFLQTSPEFAMKRLLAAGSGDIYQISKAFRAYDQGRKHNPEFTLLEWYQLNLDHWQLMQVVDELCQQCLHFPAAQRISYREIMLRYTQLDYEHQDTSAFAAFAAKHMDTSQLHNMSKDDWLNLIMGSLIEPELAKDAPLFIVDYPVTQAALARVYKNPEGLEQAARFELFFRGTELGNGYWELSDAQELEDRSKEDARQRQRLGLPERRLDPYLLSAQQQGLPDCAGVALGLDRLLMAAHGINDISSVLSFDWDNA